jgi:hypothetical protein
VSADALGNPLFLFNVAGKSALITEASGAFGRGIALALVIHEVVTPDLDTTSVPHPYPAAKVQRGELGMKIGLGFRGWTPEETQRVRDRLDDFLLRSARPSPAQRAVTPPLGTRPNPEAEVS